jgi:hypothetical protein
MLAGMLGRERVRVLTRERGMAGDFFGGRNCGVVVRHVRYNYRAGENTNLKRIRLDRLCWVVTVS